MSNTEQGMSNDEVNVGRNKPAQFRHRGSAFAIGLPELRKLVPAYGRLNQQFPSPWHLGGCEIGKAPDI